MEFIGMLKTFSTNDYKFFELVGLFVYWLQSEVMIYVFLIGVLDVVAAVVFERRMTDASIFYIIIGKLGHW